MVPFDKFSDQVKIWNPGQRREGTSSLYYITLREPLISVPSMPTNTTGVPLAPGWPQDHPWIGGPRNFWFYPDLEPENWKRHNGSFLNSVRFRSRSGKIARQFKRYTWDLLIEPIKIFNFEKIAEKPWKRNFVSILHFTKVTGESRTPARLWPHVGYRWVRLGLRITLV